MAFTSNREVLYFGSVNCPACRSCFLGRDYSGERLCIKCGVSFPTTY